MNTHKLFNLLLAFVFAFSLLGMPGPALAEEPPLNPHISVILDNFGGGRWLAGEEWTIGTQVTINIDNPNTSQLPDFTTVTSAINILPGQPGGSFKYSPDHFIYIDPGFNISVSDGATTKTLEVSDIHSTSIDVQNNRITGETSPNREIWVSANNTAIQTHSDSDGHWSGDFTGQTNLQADTVVEIKVFDDDGDFTDWFYHAFKNPSIFIGPNQGFVYVRAWPTGTFVHMTLERSENTIYTADATVGWCGDGNPAYGPCGSDEAYFEVAASGAAGYDLQPGDVITITGGGITKSMVVSALEVTYADSATKTLAGTADIGRAVIVTGCGLTDCTGSYMVMPDASGHWIANFSVLAPGMGNILVPGAGGPAGQNDDSGNSTIQAWAVPKPYIIVSPSSHWIQAREWDWSPIVDWGLDTVLTLTVDNPTNGIGVDYTGTAIMEYNPDNPGDPNDIRANFAWPDIGLQPGYIVTVGGNNAVKTLVVSPLQVNSIDVQNDTISGTASPGANIEVCVNIPDNCIHRYVTADSSGNWLADYQALGTRPDEQRTVDLKAGNNGCAEESDSDGDVTHADWRVPNPYIEASVRDNWIHAYEWPKDIEITMTISDSSETYTATMGQAPWNPGDPNDIVADFDLQGYDVKAGDVITATGNGTIKTLIVSTLEVTDFDLDNDLISGKGTTGIEIRMCAKVPGRCITRWVVPNSLGDWMANYHDPGTGNDDPDTFDVKPGSNGWAAEKDQDGDQTRFDWRVPNPYIEASATSDWVHAREWPLGTLITMNISGSNQTYTATMAQAPWNPGDPNDIVADFDLQGYDIQAGDVITASANGTTKTLTVSQLEVTDFDLDTDTISGVGTPGVQIQVCANVLNRCITRWVTPNGSGNWIANYHDPGTGSDDPDMFDVQLGSNGWAAEYKADSDRTWVDWNAPNPNFDVRANYDQVEAYQWDMGDTLTVSIDNPTTADNPDYTTTQTVTDVAPWDPSQTYVPFYLSGIYDILIGDVVSVSNGPITKTTVVANLVITDVHLDTDMINGVAEPNQTINVWTCWENTCVSRDETADANGNWVTNFAVPGEKDWEQGTMNLQPGSWIDSSVGDQDGDSTMFGWYVPINQPPVIEQIVAPVNPVQLGQSISAIATFSDPDIGDTHTVTWTWGDGSTTVTPATVPSVTTSHTYTSSGVYTITATITDAAGESATAIAQQYVVIYDPNGGFVTGGGWITSPLGAYTPDPTLTGKATFGFVSKYQKGATVPAGNTEFQFHVANMTFKSTSYDWLVIAGTKAQYKGTGTINGAGEYKFILTAIDGTPDKFRIKIWDKATGNVIYDNQLGASDTADPTTVIQGGSIVVHKAK